MRPVRWPRSSSCKDGNLSVDEVARREVTLGERDGTLIFFNACEVGATASALGTVGGWADAFLSRALPRLHRAAVGHRRGRRFDRDAGVDAEDRARPASPSGSALRDVRARHGDVSPTFYSYLLYGDVTARLDAG